MKFKAEITIMPLKELLDPQGKAVLHGLHNLGFSKIESVRIGKHIHIEVDADSKSSAEAQVEDACKKLLANPVMESYSYEIEELMNV
ncbi:MAG: phosphoribosylformylglycinamidine synthase subunit PurS [Chitinophagales bacterium]|nr:phosphoribosylformylglycinamidine synthase subunit PurS [Chitinophagales bacterium]